MRSICCGRVSTALAHSRGTHLVSQTTFEEGVNASSSPAVGVHQEGSLNPTPLMNKQEVWAGPEREQKPVQNLWAEVVLWFVYIEASPFFGQHSRNPLSPDQLGRPFQGRRACTRYISDLSSLSIGFPVRRSNPEKKDLALISAVSAVACFVRRPLLCRI